MNIWELAAQVMIFALLPLTWLCVRGEPHQRLVGFYMAGVVITLLLMLLTMAFQRMSLMDVPLTLALMSFGGGIVFAHFFERHLR